MSPRGATLIRLRRALRDVVPPDVRSLDEHSLTPTELVGAAGIDLVEQEQLDCLERWRGRLAPLFRELHVDPAINTLARGKPHLHNGQFPTPDAEIYAALLCECRPRKVLEIGAGFSTLVARKAVSYGDWECAITVVDPEPRTDVAGHANRVIRSHVEDVPLTELTLDPGDVLFVDSSHVLRSRGDLPRIFNEIVPCLAAGVLVHVHDVFIPWDYPDAYRRRLYSEQYMLQALLSGSPRYRVVFAAHCMARKHARAMQKAFGEVVGSDPLYTGSSFWFEVR